MAEAEYQFDRDSAKRIAKTVRRMESQLRPDGREVVSPRGGTDRRILAQCTSTTPNANGLFPGIQVVSVLPTPSDPQAPQLPSNPPPGAIIPATASGGWLPLGNGNQDSWLAFNTGLVPALNRVYVSVPVTYNQADGLPVYFGADPAAGNPYYIQTRNTSAVTLTSANWVTLVTLTLAHAGTYLLHADVEGTLAYTSAPAYGAIGDQLIAGPLGSVLWSGSAVSCSFATNPYPYYADEGNALSAIYTANAGDQVSVQAGIGGTLAGAIATAAATLVAVMISGPAPAGASSVNGQTGGVILVGGGGTGVGGTGGTGGSGGAGIVTSTSGTTITTNLTAAALAALNSYLASANI